MIDYFPHIYVDIINNPCLNPDGRRFGYNISTVKEAPVRLEMRSNCQDIGKM